MPAAYSALLLCVRRRPVVHYEHCRRWTMLAVTTATFAVTRCVGTALLGALGLAYCPECMLWWPGGAASSSSKGEGEDAALTLSDIRKFVGGLQAWRRGSKKAKDALPERKRDGRAAERAVYDAWVRIQAAAREKRLSEECLAALG